MKRKRSNAFLALNLAALVAGMVALAFASVPLYRLFCGATGFAGTPRRGAASQQVIDRTIMIRFNADTDPSLPWDFKPEILQVPVKVGENHLAYFIAHNRTGHAITGRAAYNVLPTSAGAYFVKVACFCFKNQMLGPHQTAHMPVNFYVDPSIMGDPEMDEVKTITLSYTFFPVTSERK